MPAPRPFAFASRSLLLLAVAVMGSGCAAPRPTVGGEVVSWGTMREVLREGRSEARAVPVRLVGPASIGVGAMADLAGEITVVDGRVLVAVADAAGTESAATGKCQVRDAGAADSATLLVLAEVPTWEVFALGACPSYADLEDAIAARLQQQGRDLAEPVPVRVRGAASNLELHVIAGACPIAHPGGPAPWRFEGAADRVELVGFFVEGAAGRFTHHGRRSHLHAVTDQRMGHLDEVALDTAVLLLPAR